MHDDADTKSRSKVSKVVNHSTFRPITRHTGKPVVKYFMSKKIIDFINNLNYSLKMGLKNILGSSKHIITALIPKEVARTLK